VTAHVLDAARDRDVGRAEGDWWSLAEGDVIRSVKVEQVEP